MISQPHHKAEWQVALPIVSESWPSGISMFDAPERGTNLAISKKWRRHQRGCACALARRAQIRLQQAERLTLAKLRGMLDSLGAIASDVTVHDCTDLQPDHWSPTASFVRLESSPSPTVAAVAARPPMERCTAGVAARIVKHDARNEAIEPFIERVNALSTIHEVLQSKCQRRGSKLPLQVTFEFNCLVGDSSDEHCSLIFDDDRHAYIIRTDPFGECTVVSPILSLASTSSVIELARLLRDVHHGCWNAMQLEAAACLNSHDFVGGTRNSGSKNIVSFYVQQTAHELVLSSTSRMF
mmetsp:Transcript_17478/g.44768  ORF Transcript_17478/g.44768 Transcript_17478/m.44768 type:complete len:297 (-) Transcript_17478:212-1102(-)